MDFPKYHKAHHAMDRLMLYWSAALIAMLISMSASGETENQQLAEFSIKTRLREMLGNGG